MNYIDGTALFAIPGITIKSVILYAANRKNGQGASFYTCVDVIEGVIPAKLDLIKYAINRQCRGLAFLEDDWKFSRIFKFIINC